MPVKLALFSRFSRLLLLSSLVLLAAYCFTGCQSLPPNSLGTHDSSSWTQEIAAFDASDRTNPPPEHPIVFVGSSSIRMWYTLASDFPGLPVVNRGFGGSQLADSVNFAHQLITRYHPRQVVIYAGGNDIHAGKPPELVYGDFVALVQRIRKQLPSTRIAYISSAPNPSRWAEVEKVKTLNALVADYCRSHKVDFINVFPLMLGPDGKPKPDIYLPDKLHMNERGYALWKGAVGPYLRPRH
jgi:lysophospholipase L1-like esterase